jgi:hypothetical protein
MNIKKGNFSSLKIIQGLGNSFNLYPSPKNTEAPLEKGASVSEKFIINLSAATFFSISLLWLPVLCFKLKISSSRSGLNLIEKPDIIATKKKIKRHQGVRAVQTEREQHIVRACFKGCFFRCRRHRRCERVSEQGNIVCGAIHNVIFLIPRAPDQRNLSSVDGEIMACTENNKAISFIKLNKGERKEREREKKRARGAEFFP